MWEVKQENKLKHEQCRLYKSWATDVISEFWSKGKREPRASNSVHVNHADATPHFSEELFPKLCSQRRCSSVLVLKASGLVTSCHLPKTHSQHLRVRPGHLCNKPCRWLSCWPHAGDPCLAASSHILHTCSETPNTPPRGVFPRHHESKATLQSPETPDPGDSWSV